MTRLVQEHAYSAPETAFLLRLELGPIREWRDALTDMRIGKASITGHVLLPAGHTWDRVKRPMYTKTAIVNFIDKVRASCADAQRRMPPQATMVVLDTDDVRNWRNRELPPAARTRRHFIGSQLALAA